MLIYLSIEFSTKKIKKLEIFYITKIIFVVLHKKGILLLCKMPNFDFINV